MRRLNLVRHDNDRRNSFQGMSGARARESYRKQRIFRGRRKTMTTRSQENEDGDRDRDKGRDRAWTAGKQAVSQWILDWAIHPTAINKRHFLTTDSPPCVALRRHDKRLEQLRRFLTDSRHNCSKPGRRTPNPRSQSSGSTCIAEGLSICGLISQQKRGMQAGGKTRPPLGRSFSSFGGVSLFACIGRLRSVVRWRILSLHVSKL